MEPGKWVFLRRLIERGWGKNHTGFLVPHFDTTVGQAVTPILHRAPGLSVKAKPHCLLRP